VTTEAELIAAIAANLDDDGPRQVFADWLVEQGDPRGELVHLQLAHAQLPPGDERAKEAGKRVAALLEEHGARWLGRLLELRKREIAFAFHRGVIGEVRSRAAILGRNATQILAAAPLLTRVVVATDRDDNDLSKLGPLAERAREMELETPRPHRLTGWDALELPSLRVLGFSTITLGAGDLAVLAKTPALESLRFFHCRFNKGVVESFGALRQLRALDATALHLGPRLGELASGWHLVEASLAGNELGPAGVRALLPALATARFVDLRGNELTTAELPALLDGLPAVATLELGGNKLGDAGAALIAQHPAARGLTRLHLGDAGITRDGARALAAAPNLANLTSLVLTGARFDPATEELLVHSPHLAKARIYAGDRRLARPREPS